MGNGNKSSSSVAKKKSGKVTSFGEPSGVKDILQTSLEEVKNVGRQGGDGESLPHTPPNEPVNLLGVQAKESSDSSPFVIHFRIDALAVLLFIISLATRLYRLDQPQNVV